MSRDDEQNLPVSSPTPAAEEDVVEAEFVETLAQPQGAIDFNSDEPLIEQILKRERLDRSDKTLEQKGCFARVALLISIAAFLALISWQLIWGWLCP